jgi:hypothetical protein
MAISNTNILIKRSTTTTTPGTLKAGELAYSYSSNSFFIGTPTGDGVLAIGGFNSFGAANTATSSNVVNTLVKRDANGAFYGRLFGVSNTAVALDTAQNFSITGDVLASAVSFNGTGAVALSSSLNSINPNSGTFGSTTTIPVITVGANGRITGVTTSAVATSFNISDGTTSNTINNGSTFYHLGTKGITTTVTSNTVTFGVDTTILRSNTTGGMQVISTDLTVAGNLIISGTATYVNTATVQTSDSLIKLAANNTTGDVVDIGFYGVSNTNTSLSNSNTYHGLVREGSGGGTDAGKFFLFKNLPTDPTNNTITYASATRATLVANLTGGMISGLANTIGVIDGGTGQSTFTSGQMLIGSGQNGLTQIANSTVAIGQSFGSASVVPVFTTDAYGRVVSATNTSIAIAASQVTSGTLAIAQGGTNNSSFTNFQLVNYNGTSISSVANVTTSVTGTLSASQTITSITTDGYGRLTAYTGAAIAIAGSAITSGTVGTTVGGTGLTSFTSGGALYATSTSALTSGTLPLTAGGTGATAFTNGQVVIGNGTTSLVSLANSTYALTGALQSNNTITSLTVDAYGRVTAATGAAISGLTVSQGGTGLATAATNGIVFGNGTNALGVTAIAGGGSDQTWSNQILTVTNAGIPVWSSAMDGGTF